MLPNYQVRSPFVLKHTTSWRASVASETVLGVDNAKSGICDRFWENRPKRGKQIFSVSPGKALWVDFFRKIFYGRNG